MGDITTGTTTTGTTTGTYDDGDISTYERLCVTRPKPKKKAGPIRQGAKKA